MICFMCKGAVKDGFSTFTVDIGKCVVVIRNVPSGICEQCGDASYDDETSARLEEIVDSFKEQARAEIAVVNYSSQAA